MDENKKDRSIEEMTDVEKVEAGVPVASAEKAIIEDAPTEAAAERKPADLPGDEVGEEAEGPANHYAAVEKGLNAKTGDDALPEEAQKPGSDFKEKYWKPYLWPVATLVAICLVASLLLGITNSITAPIIAENEANALYAAFFDVLPEADGFEDVDLGDELPSGITQMVEATNGAGYVIVAYASGYGGAVPAVVAFDAGGTIVGIQFPENDETPGLGSRITEPAFSEQFVGLEGNVSGQVDMLSGATISSNAAVAAVNAAQSLFAQQVLGEESGELSGDELLASLVPGAAGFEEISITLPNGVDAAWRATDGSGYVISAAVRGYMGDVPVLVGLDEQGVIVGIHFTENEETPGLGSRVTEEDFGAQFIGLSGEIAGQVDALSGATVSSNAAFEAVQAALDALDTVKGAA